MKPMDCLRSIAAAGMSYHIGESIAPELMSILNSDPLKASAILTLFTIPIVGYCIPRLKDSESRAEVKAWIKYKLYE